MSFTDSFTRADSAHLGDPWVEETPAGDTSGFFGIASDLAVPNTYNNDGQIWVDTPGGRNGTYSLTIQDLEVGGAVGITVRGQDINNKVLVEVTNTGLAVYEDVAASFSLLGSTGDHWTTPGDVLEVVVDDASITVKLNGTTHITTSTTRVGALHGMFAQQGTGGSTQISEYSFTADDTALPFSDNFNRADGAPGAPWHDQSGDYAIASDILTKTATADYYLRIQSDHADFDEQVTLTVGALTNYSGLHGRATVAEGDGLGHTYGDYTFTFPDPIEGDNTGHLSFWIFYNGARVDQFVAEGIPQPSNGDVVTLRMRAVGQIVTLWFNGTKVYQSFVANTAYTENLCHGVGIYGSNGGTMDDYSLDVGVADDPVSLPFTDNFTRADNHYLGDPWTVVNGAETGAIGIVGDQAVSLGGAYPSALVETGLADCYATCTVDVGSGIVGGLALRYNLTDASGDRIGVYIGASGALYIDQIHGGSYGSIGTYGSGYGSGSHVIEAWLVGTTVVAAVDGVVLVTATVLSSAITTHGLVLQFSGSPVITAFGIDVAPETVTLPFTDDFNRADTPTLVPPWRNELGVMGIASDTATLKSSGSVFGAFAAIATVDTGLTDHVAEVVTLNESKNTASPVIRYTDNTSFVVLDTEQDTGLYEVVAGVPTKILTVTSAPGDTLKVTALGSTVEAFVNGVSQGTATTSVLSGTRTGIFGYDSNGQGLISVADSFTTDTSVVFVGVDLPDPAGYDEGPAGGFVTTVFYLPDPPGYDEGPAGGFSIGGAPLAFDLPDPAGYDQGPAGGFTPPMWFNLPNPPGYSDEFDGFDLGDRPVHRWMFEDPLNGNERYYFAINPNKMSTPYVAHTTISQGRSPISGIIGSARTPVRATEWTFSGVIRDIAFQNALAYWFEKGHKVLLTDHIGRRWVVMPELFGPYPRPNRKSVDHRWLYDAKVYCYGPG